MVYKKVSKSSVGKSPKAGGPNRAPMKPLSKSVIRSPKAGGPNKPPLAYKKSVSMSPRSSAYKGPMAGGPNRAPMKPLSKSVSRSPKAGGPNKPPLAYKKSVSMSPKAGGPNKPPPVAQWMGRSPKAGGPNKPPPQRSSAYKKAGPLPTPPAMAGGPNRPTKRSTSDPKPSPGQSTYASPILGRRPGQQTGTTYIPLTRFSSYDYTTGQASAGGTNRTRPASYRELQALERQQAANIKNPSDKNKKFRYPMTYK